MRINASKTKELLKRTPGKQRKADLLDGEPLEDVDKFKYLSSMCFANVQGTEKILDRISVACFALPRLQACLWSHREISFVKRAMVYLAVVRSILLYECETWPAHAADEGMLVIFDNDSIHPSVNWLRMIEKGLGEKFKRVRADCKAWNASSRDVVYSIGNAGSIHLGGMSSAGKYGLL